jgi:hypothetical protein
MDRNRPVLHPRGEITLDLGEQRLTLRLTLQALGEIEAGFGASGLKALGERLSQGNLGVGDLLRLLGPLVRGGGAALGDAEIARLLEARHLAAILEAIGALFAQGFETPPNP